MSRIPWWAAALAALLPICAAAQRQEYMTSGFGMACKAGQMGNVPMPPRHDSCDFRVRMGRDDAAAAAEQTVWKLAGYYEWPTSALAMSVTSTDEDDAAAGTGLRTVLVDCLDEDLKEKPQTVTLDGLTPVALSIPCRRINGMTGLTAGTSGGNEGGVYVGVGPWDAQGVPTGKYGYIDTVASPRKLNVDETGVYTCPSDATCALFNIVPGSASNVEMRLMSREAGGLWNLFASLDFANSFPPLAASGQWIQGGTDVECLASSISGNVAVGCRVEIFIIRKGANRPGSGILFLIPLAPLRRKLRVLLAATLLAFSVPAAAQLQLLNSGGANCRMGKYKDENMPANSDACDFFTKFGFCASIGPAAWETIWSLGLLYAFPPSAVAMTISSTDADDTAAGAGARTATVFCLDDDLLEINDGPGALGQTVALNGQAGVPLPVACERVHRIIIATSGASLGNEGDIHVGTGTVTAGVPVTTYAYVAPPDGRPPNQTQMAVYTCPSDATCLIRWFHIKSSGNVTVRMMVRAPGELMREFIKFPFTANAPPALEDGRFIVGGTDVLCEAESVTGNVGVGCWFDVYVLRTSADRNASMDWRPLPWEETLPVAPVLACVDPWRVVAVR